MNNITVAMTGASGAVYTIRLLEQLLKAGIQVQFLCSQPGQIVFAMESELKLSGDTKKMQQQLIDHFKCPPEQINVYGKNQWGAPVASGSSVSDAMVVCPCSMGSLASIANGMSNNLIHRAADVVLKERRKLVLVPRETPFSSLHLENMLKLSNMGAVILPPSPGFYNGESTIQQLIDFVVSRILDQLGIDNKLAPRWGQD
jgi:4-hydroxy-3-polyprenylbenzoate decarboxylase